MKEKGEKETPGIKIYN